MGDQYVVLKTHQGQLRGQTKTSLFSGKKYLAFQGIPYAKPPLGDLRFKAPEPFGCWEGVRDALKDSSDCMQQKPRWAMQPGQDASDIVYGDEDCLYLNVYTNKLPGDSSPLQPVMVHIPGGGFAGGSGGSHMSGPDFLLEDQVVFVSINYRCGAFGFLSLEMEEVPGNAGLKDQVLALHWVQDNIRLFAGDPDNVTVFGISAGGASVQYHLLSPCSKGLFHKAIVQSGSCLNPWARQLQPRRNAALLAGALGCTDQHPAHILTFLQSASAEDIICAQRDITDDKDCDSMLGLMFAPSVETSGREPFLSDYPDRLMKRGQFCNVPVIQGFVANEGSVAVCNGRLSNNMIEDHNNSPALFAGPALGLVLSDEEKEEVGSAITDLYTEGKPVTLDNINQHLDFQSDIIVNVGLEITRKYLLKHSTHSLYSYFFTNHTRCYCSVLKSVLPTEELYSKISMSETCHAGEAMHLFALSLSGETKLQDISTEDRTTIRKLVKTWTSFATSGDPNCEEAGVKWDPDSEENPCFMELGEHWAMRKGRPFPERMKFWNQLHAKLSS